MSLQGYYRVPAIKGDQIVFVSEDDLWTTSLSEGTTARRLTTGLGMSTTPVFSPDGSWLAYSCNEEGSLELYVMPSQGGIARRLTFFGETLSVIAWTEKGIIFSSSAREPFARVNTLWCIAPEGGAPERLPIGPVNYISFEGELSVIQRHGYREYGFWKRYRGGTAGEVWIDRKGDQNYEKLIHLKSDFSRPLWIQNRIYFASDHEGHGNLYSCNLEGEDLKPHTFHQDYYVRNQATDGEKIVYHLGGDLYVYDTIAQKEQKVEFLYHGTRPQRNRKHVNTTRYLSDYALHPHGSHLAIAARGKVFSFANWEGAILSLAEAHGVRYRLPRWLSKGERVLVVSDQTGQDQLEIYEAGTGRIISQSALADLGQILELYVNPHKDEVVFVNHRSELIWLDLATWQHHLIERHPYGKMQGIVWSPDGEWIAFSSAVTRRTMAIKIFEVATRTVTQVTQPVLKDIAPAFDPEGKYLYFLSYRQFEPTWDSLQFDLGFPRGMRPYLITLQKDLLSPFSQKAPDLVVKEEEENKEEKKSRKKGKEKEADKKEIKKIVIDFEGIENRIQAFPVEDGIYTQIVGVKGKALFVGWPIEEETEDDYQRSSEYDDSGFVEAYDFEAQKVEPWIDQVSEIDLSYDAQWLVYRCSRGLRVIKSEDKYEDRGEGDKSGRRSGWIDLGRVTVIVDPISEWEQIFKEAWRLQRDYFWRENMSNVNWQDIFTRYFRLIPRLSTRGELSDVLWEMQGELATSHAYVIGGDLRRPPSWTQGLLGAEFVFDEKHQAYRIVSLIKGDLWKAASTSPLQKPGLNIQEGDLLWEINNKALGFNTPPEGHLVQQAGYEVNLTVSDSRGQNKRAVVVRPIASHGPGIYRDWVEANRRYVHEKTQDRVGYIHIPDMNAKGFSEFHRGFLSECDRDGLVIDVRFNGGGNVSPLLLEKLARRRLGYDASRWFDVMPYPEDSPLGPMVALTNQYAGSDGDMFSYAFKAMKLGPLIGKRTWGGVVGIWPRHALIDGGLTTQPEFSFWFKDLEWSIENYGVDPDIEIDITPQDYAQKRDPQLDRAIEEVLKIIKEYPVINPEIARRKGIVL